MKSLTIYKHKMRTIPLFCGILLLISGLFSIFFISEGPTSIYNINNTPNPISSYDYAPIQNNQEGSNVGVLLNSTAQINRTISNGDWTYYGPLDYRSNPWRMELPGRAISDSSVNWKLQQGTVIIKGLSERNNFIPDYQSGPLWNSFESNAWYYSPYFYLDNYWGAQPVVTNQLQNIIPQSGYTTNTTEFVTPGSQDFGESETGVGFMQLNNSRRYYTYSLADNLTYSPIAQITNLSMFNVQRQSVWYQNAAQIGYNNYYTANAEPESTTVVNKGSQTDWAWGNSQGFYNSNHSINSNYISSDLALNTYYRLYYSQTKPGTTGTFYTRTTANWDVTVNKIIEFRMPFYYYDQSIISPNVKMSADLLFINLGKPFTSNVFNDMGNGVNGGLELLPNSRVEYLIVNRGTSTPVGSTVSKFLSVDGGGYISNTSCDISGVGDAGNVITTGWYEMLIRVNIEFRSYGALDKTGNTLGEGVSGTSSVNVPYFNSIDGVRTIIANPIVTIEESTILADPSKPNGAENFIESAPIPWNSRMLNDTSPILSFGYKLSDTLRSAENYLYEARVCAKLRLNYNSGQVYEYKISSPYNLREISNFGGIDRFQWYLNSTVQQAFNISLSNFTIHVGIFLGPQFTLKLNSSPYSRIYFNNINFTLNTIPDPAQLNLKLEFLNTGGGSYLFGFTNYGEYSMFSFLPGSIISNLYWDSNSINDCFRFNSFYPVQFDFSATFVANYSNWDVKTNIAAIAGNELFVELNQTINTPKPYAFDDWYGKSGSMGPIYNSNFTSYWNDNFNIFLVIPKFTNGNDTFWKLNWGIDNNNPIFQIRRIGTTNYFTWNRNIEIYREINPINIYGNPVKNFGVVQVCYLDNALFYGYTYSGYINHGIDQMDWDLQFTIPNELGQIILDKNPPSFTPPGLTEFIVTDGTNDAVHIQVEKRNTILTSPTNCSLNYYWLQPNETILKSRSSLAGNLNQAGYYNSTAEGSYIAGIDSEDIGQNYIALAIYAVSDISSSGRIQGEQYLNGIYRMGMNYSLFYLRESGEKYNPPVFLFSPSDLAQDYNTAGTILRWQIGYSYFTGGEYGNYSLFYDGALIQTGIWNDLDNITYMIPADLSIKMHHYELEVSNLYANATDSVFVTILNKLPFVVYTPNSAQYIFGSIGNTLSWTFADDQTWLNYPQTDALQYSIFQNDSLIETGYWTNNTNIVYNIPSNLAVGTYLYHVKFTDGYDNVTTGTTTITINPIANNLPYVISTPNNIEYVYGSIGNTLSWTFADDQTWLNYPQTDALQYALFRNDTLIKTGFWLNNTAVIYPLPNLLDVGTYQYYITFTDGFDNVTTNISIVTIVHNPKPTIISNPPIRIAIGSINHIIQWNIYDTTVTGNPTYTIFVNGTVIVQTGFWTSGSNVTYTLPNTLAWGTHNYTLVADDGYSELLGASHNSTSTAVVVSVESNIPVLNELSQNKTSSPEVTLSWSTTADAISYYIYRTTIPINSTQGQTPIAIVNTTNYVDLLPSMGVYYYYIAGFNGSSLSGLSNSQFIEYIPFNATMISIAVNNMLLTFTNVPNSTFPWFSQTQVNYDGQYAIQSGATGHNGLSAIETKVNGKGIISFYWIVSSESNADFLSFYVNNILISRISGNTNWVKFEYRISTSGENTLKWEYRKDSALSAGQDCGWLDIIHWISYPLDSPVISTIIPNPSSTGIINIQWNQVSGATSYRVYRATYIITSIDNLTPLVLITSNEFQDNITINGTYYYVVVAVNNSGESEISNCRYVTVAIPPPEPQTNSTTTTTTTTSTTTPRSSSINPFKQVSGYPISLLFITILAFGVMLTYNKHRKVMINP
jgi:hypothetical protein